ncbi:hypothetical protein LCM20_16680 [Halobacillus litoralis]|uniref:hypothetical protein n=1 Tax=Halobacillus litoralis TaxID=45668 RepID=UPI001CD75862|nr:hypothetical protein [Halobacillus litoralis]MCA0972246.1 hypothetical protein [Halobacillus litoralis]
MKKFLFLMGITLTVLGIHSPTSYAQLNCGKYDCETVYAKFEAKVPGYDHKISLISHSSKWDDAAELKFLAVQLFDNTFGEEIRSLDRIILVDDDHHFGSAFYTYTSSDNTFKGEIVFEEAQSIKSLKDEVRTLAHEYGHHFTQYHWWKNNESIRNYENLSYKNARNIVDPLLSDHYQDDHMWGIQEMAAEDYVLLYGSETANKSGNIPQENPYNPLATHVKGLDTYFEGLSGVSPRVHYQIPSNQMEIQVKEVSDSHIRIGLNSGVTNPEMSRMVLAEEVFPYDRGRGTVTDLSVVMDGERYFSIDYRNREIFEDHPAVLVAYEYFEGVWTSQRKDINLGDILSKAGKNVLPNDEKNTLERISFFRYGKEDDTKIEVNQLTLDLGYEPRFEKELVLRDGSNPYMSSKRRDIYTYEPTLIRVDPVTDQVIPLKAGEGNMRLSLKGYVTKSIPFTVLPEARSIEGVDEVSESKEWTIKLSEAIKPSSVNKENIYIRNGHGFIIKSTIQQVKPNVIKVKGNEEQLEEGGTFGLFVRNLEDMDGHATSPVKKEFYIDPSIDESKVLPKENYIDVIEGDMTTDEVKELLRTEPYYTFGDREYMNQDYMVDKIFGHPVDNTVFIDRMSIEYTSDEVMSLRYWGESNQTKEKLRLTFYQDLVDEYGTPDESFEEVGYLNHNGNVFVDKWKLDDKTIELTVYEEEEKRAFRIRSSYQ